MNEHYTIFQEGALRNNDLNQEYMCLTYVSSISICTIIIELVLNGQFLLLCRRLNV